MKYKTIESGYPDSFDKMVNKAIKESWQIVPNSFCVSGKQHNQIFAILMYKSEP